MYYYYYFYFSPRSPFLSNALLSVLFVKALSQVSGIMPGVNKVPFLWRTLGNWPIFTTCYWKKKIICSWKKTLTHIDVIGKEYVPLHLIQINRLTRIPHSHLLFIPKWPYPSFDSLFLMEFVGLSENQSPVVFHLFKMYEGRSRLALIRTDVNLGKCQWRVPGARWYLRHTAASHALTLGESAE